MEDNSKQLIDVLKKYKNIMIYIKGSPDPDVIASSYAMKIICSYFGINSEIYSFNNISLQENKTFVEVMGIQINFGEYKKEVKNYDAYLILDHQSALVDNLTNKIPCVIHIDHHEAVKEDIKVDFKLIRNDVGSVSTIVALMLKNLNLNFDEKIMRSISTALYFGIQNDTNQFTHAVKLDYKAINYLSKYSDNEKIQKITKTPLSKETIALLWEAIENQTLYKDWMIAGVGYVDESNRDSIAIIADFLLNREEVVTVVVFAIIVKRDNSGLTLDASFRSVQEHLNLNDIIKRITSEGGARKFKGAYQIPLDYFSKCPEKDQLWELVKCTTIEVLKDSRDKVYVTELKGIYKKLKGWADKLFKKK